MKLTQKILIGAIIFICGLFWYSFYYIKPPNEKPIKAPLQGKKIDVVYNWYDLADKEFREFRNQWYEREKEKISNLIYSPNLLKFSLDYTRFWLRSTDTYCSWYPSTIYVIVPDGVPVPSINRFNPRIVVVSYNDLFPEKFLPTFNDNAILWTLRYIPNLSENFIYFNRNSYLANELKLEHWITEYGSYGIPLKRDFDPISIEPEKPAQLPALNFTLNLLFSKFPNVTPFVFPVESRGPLLLRKSILAELEVHFENPVHETLGHRFESPTDLLVPELYYHYTMIQNLLQRQSVDVSNSFDFVDKNSDGFLTQDEIRRISPVLDDGKPVSISKSEIQNFPNLVRDLENSFVIPERYRYHMLPGLTEIVHWSESLSDLTKSLKEISHFRPVSYYFDSRSINGKLPTIKKSLENFFFDLYPQVSEYENNVEDFEEIGLWLGIGIMVCGTLCCWGISLILGVKGRVLKKK